MHHGRHTPSSSGNYSDFYGNDEEIAFMNMFCLRVHDKDPSEMKTPASQQSLKETWSLNLMPEESKTGMSWHLNVD